MANFDEKREVTDAHTQPCLSSQAPQDPLKLCPQSIAQAYDMGIFFPKGNQRVFNFNCGEWKLS